jgi:hypothetical protein
LKLAHVVGLVAALAIVPAVAHAQYVVNQDSTLQGLQRVYVHFDTSAAALSPQVMAGVQSSVSLELRKAGVRTVHSLEELNGATDGILDVVLVKIPRALSTDFIVRLAVRQSAALSRTQQPFFLLTWFYEDNGRNVSPDQAGPAMVSKGVDKLLAAWLDNNNR